MEKIVILAGDTDTSRIMFNGLKNDFNIIKVIQEKPESTMIFMGRRIKRLGWVKVIGQISFMLFNKLFKKTSNWRIEQIKQTFNLDSNNYPEDILEEVESVNSKKVIQKLKNIHPDVVIVNGTRIISEKMLKAISAPFINTHTGITPKYRGVHGGYWALAQQDPENCGVTIHLVDRGIDTGGILYQAKIKPDSKDNFNTYPYLQYAKAIPLMRKAIADILKNRIAVHSNQLDSQLWYHPTIFEYLKYRIFGGIK
jgi:folate-dependent phosphoribosylglycinamide formyltransferase PurN